MIAYLDTQVAVYLAEGTTKRISRDGQALIQRADLLLSPIALVEIEILHEIRRLRMSARDIRRKLEQEVGLRVCDLPFSAVAEIACDEGWTRDPFDRTIVAHAKANGYADLISSDAMIQKHYPRTVW